MGANPEQTGSLDELQAFLDAERNVTVRRAELMRRFTDNIGRTVSVEGVPRTIIVATSTRDGRSPGATHVTVGKSGSGKREPVTIDGGTLLSVDGVNGLARRSEEIAVGLPPSDIEVADPNALRVLGYAFPITALRKVVFEEPISGEADA